MIIVSRECMTTEHLEAYSDSLEARKKYWNAVRKERFVIEDTDTGECVRLGTKQVLQVVGALLGRCWYRPETIYKEVKRQRAGYSEYIRSFYDEDGNPQGEFGPVPIPEFNYETGELSS